MNDNERIVAASLSAESNGGNLSEFIKNNKLNLVLAAVSLELVSAALMPNHALASEKQSNPPVPQNYENVVNGSEPITPPTEDEGSHNSDFLLAFIGAAAGSAITSSMMRRKR